MNPSGNQTDLTIPQAAAHIGCSVSVIRKHLRGEKFFRGAYQQVRPKGGCPLWLIPLADADFYKRIYQMYKDAGWI